MTNDCGCVGDNLCFAHKLAYWRETGGLNISPAATPSRRNNVPGTTFAPKNSWERGVATDNRGVPILRPEDMSPMPIKEYGERRHELNEGRQKLAHSTPTKESE